MPKQRLTQYLAVCLSLGIVLVLAGCGGQPAAAPTLEPHGLAPATPAEPTPSYVQQNRDDPRVAAIDGALKSAVQGREDIAAFLVNDVIIDHITSSDDGKLSLVWLALVDKETGQVVPGEPGLAVARLNSKKEWKITLQADKEWAKSLQQVPDSMLDPDIRDQYLPGQQQVAKEHQVFTGYKLPWEGGRKIHVTGSIGHVFTYKTCPTTCLYAFDFADGTQFPVLAAKGGRVKYAVWQYPNGNTEHANYLVLEDTTTTPTTYQVYYHLAQNSIPVKLRTTGAAVVQGQLIGNADDTGASTANHLHFHVHANASSYWGTSVDVVFSDVSDNGGRPRTCLEARNFPGYGSQCQSGDWYESNNTDHENPTGGFTSPVADAAVNASTLAVKGWAKDDQGVSSVQVMMTYDGNWQPIGPKLTGTSWSTSLNLCKAKVPAGIFFLALKVTDTSGKVVDGVGMMPLNMNYVCFPPTPTPTPIPTCEINENQAAVYVNPDFTGICTILEIGKYTDPKALGKVGDNNAESIRLGSGVMATLYGAASLKGNKAVLLDSSANLADTEVGANALSSLVIQSRPLPPVAPLLTLPEKPTEKDVLTLAWAAADGADEYRADLSSSTGFSKSLDWQKGFTWKVGALPAGEYTWTVWTRNLVGEAHSVGQFKVAVPDLPSVSQMNLLATTSDSTAVLLTWQVLEGEADLGHFEIEVKEGAGQWATWNNDLPAGARQAWFVGAPGKTYGFRLRSVDAAGNAEDYPGEPEAVTRIAADCQPDDLEGKNGDNQAADAVTLEIDQMQAHNFCPAADEDWLMFPAQAGKKYRIATTPLQAGGAAGIQLYGVAAKDVLGEVKPADPASPAMLDWQAPADGIYYLRLSPALPGISGSATRYTVKIEQTGAVSLPGVVCGSLFLPALWFVVKLFSSLRKKGAVKK